MFDMHQLLTVGVDLPVENESKVKKTQGEASVQISWKILNENLLHGSGDFSKMPIMICYFLKWANS